MSNGETWLVVSPHFDDAVLSASQLLLQHPGSFVATACSGVPPSSLVASDWDRQSGFHSASEAAIARRDEDRRALEILRSTQVLLGGFDGPYCAPGRVHEDPAKGSDRFSSLVTSIAQQLDHLRPDHVVIPTGIAHEDHVATRNAAIVALVEFGTRNVFAYCDLPYSLAHRALLDAQLEALQAGEVLETGGTMNSIDKRRAASCYVSQLDQLATSFGPHWDATFDVRNERVQRLELTFLREFARTLDGPHASR